MGQASDSLLRIRRRILVLLVLHYANTYMDRVCIAAVAPMIRSEFGIDHLSLGVIFTVFSIPYALTQIPVGRMADRFGARPVLTAIVTLWSVCTMAVALTWDRFSLAVCRFLFGAAQGGAFPVASRAVAEWFPASARGFVQGITHTGARLAGAATPPLAVGLAVWWGWRAPFLVLGALGLLWVVFWHREFRDRPADHPRLQGDASVPMPVSGSPDSGPTHWRALLRDANLWRLNAMYFCYVYAFWVYITWFPSYLLESRGYSTGMAGVLAAAPLLAGAAANTLGGRLSDWLSLRRGLRFGRRSVGCCGFLAAAVLMVPAALHPGPLVALVLFTAAAAALESTTGASWAAAVDMGRSDTGAVSGLMNTCGNLGGALSPLVFGVLLEVTGTWAAPFLVVSGVCLAGGLLWLGVDPEKPVAFAKNRPEAV